MGIDAAVEQIEGWAQTPEQQLELTIALVKALLERGLCAGDSPVQNVGPRFVPWRDQDPDTVVSLIRLEWKRNDEFPSWGDGPWFTAPRLCRLDA